MKKSHFLTLFSVTLLSIFLVGVALAQDNLPNGQINSLSGSFVTFDPSAGGDSCFITGNAHTFCFRAESFTNDFAPVEALLQRFPADWTVSNIYVSGTPYCDSDGYWGNFSWSFQSDPYEVAISHPRYQGPVDHCVAYYCFDVIAGTGAPAALESWYWSGVEAGELPRHPCSVDGYTPTGWIACDEALAPLAVIPWCGENPVLTHSSKSAPEEVIAGDPIPYTITISNSGVAPALDASMVDPLPAGTVYNGDVACSSGTCTFDVNKIMWNGQVGTETNISTLLLDQAPDHKDAFLDDASCDSCGAGKQVLAENFVLDNPSTLEQIVLWSIYTPLDIAATPDHLRVRIHQDTAGLPGPVIYDESDVSYERFQTGVILYQTMHEWKHTLTLGSWVHLPPGSYWVEIYNDTGYGTDDFRWVTGYADTLGHGLPSAAFSSTAPGAYWYGGLNNLAFQLWGTENPLENPVTVTFSVTPDGLSCGDIVFNQATINDPQILEPVVVESSTALVKPSIYFQDFENGDGGYINAGPAPWTWGPPPAGLAPAHSGVNVWHTDSPYANNAYYMLDTPWIDLSGADPDFNLLLQWWQKLDVEADRDYAAVYVSTDGDTWTNLWTGSYRGEWQQATVNLSPYAGLPIKLRFQLVTDISITYSGWAIDDVTIRNGCEKLVPDIVVTSPPLEKTLLPGETSTLQFTIENAGTANLTWSADDGVTWLSEQPSSGTLSPNTSLKVTATFDSAGLAPDVYTTDIVLTSNDPYEPEITLPVTLTVFQPEADLELVLSALPAEAKVGEFITYNLEVINNGPQHAVNVVVVDMLPELVTFVSAEGCMESAGVIACQLGDLESGFDATRTIVVTANAIGTAINSAMVSSEVFDPDPTNNNSIAATPIEPAILKQYLPYVLRN